MKNFWMLCALALVLCCVLGIAGQTVSVIAQDIPVVSGVTEFVENDVEGDVAGIYENFLVFDEHGKFLTEKRAVSLGDVIIDRDFNKYEIVVIDDEKLVAKARFVEKLEKPKIHKKKIQEVSGGDIGVIALYSTHNDESYILGDGTESVYGAGGIHDVGARLKKSLEGRRVQVLFDESLHIPHDGSAYTRSRATAKSLLEQKPNAIFDVHRDGASRSFYLTEDEEGKACSKVRIVIGKANPKMEENLQFALWLVSVAEVLHPHLIADVYMGSGKYNQDLSNKAILFEMGCHKIEKEYVMRSVDALSEVIVETLFDTTVDSENGNLTIGPTETEQPSQTVDEILDEIATEGQGDGMWVIVAVAMFVVGVGGFWIFRAIRVKNMGN